MKKLLKNIECPDCQHPRADRYESKKKPGTFFWQCRACGEFFQDADGKPGERFGYEPGEAAWIIQAAELCSTAADLHDLLKRRGASEPGIDRRFRLVTESGFIEIGTETERGSLRITPAGKALADEYGAWRGHPQGPAGQHI